MSGVELQAAVSDQSLDIVELVGKQVELTRQPLNLEFGAAVYVVIQLAAQTVFLILPILAHHDDGRLHGGNHGKKEIQQNKWVGIPGCLSENYIDGGIDHDEHHEGDDERPGATEMGHGIR